MKELEGALAPLLFFYLLEIFAGRGCRRWCLFPVRWGLLDGHTGAVVCPYVV